jgi:hypothetical protein
MTKTLLRTAALVPLAIVAVLAFLAVTPQSTEAAELCWQTKGEICVSLTPDPDTNPVNTDHTVTMSVTLNGDPFDAPWEGGFVVLTGPNAGDSTVQVLDANGQATFTYTGDGGAGTDEIVGVVCEVDFCDGVVACLLDTAGCIDDIIADCNPPEIQNGPARPLRTQIFCIGPVEAAKTWEDPTPTPSGTPVLAPATAVPSPTPAQLPDSGGNPDDSGASWMAIAIAATFAVASGGALVFARRRISR